MTDTSNAKPRHAKGITLTDTRHHYGAQAALPLLVIDSDHCHAVIALQGAQLLEFQPANDTPWLWLGPAATFAEGRPIRGGIPVCLPWFGVNRKDPHKPRHGFVRYSPWQLQQVREHHDSVLVELVYHYHSEQPELFATPFEARLQLHCGRELQLALTLINNGSEAADFSWAFHSYFAVTSLASCSVSGLAGCDYLDNTRGLARFSQVGNIVFGAEVDRVFEATTAPQQVNTGHTLAVSGIHCPSCIVWNPGISQTTQTDDIKEGFQDFICVERGCAFDDTIHLNAGCSFTATMTIKPADHQTNQLAD